MDDVVLDTVWKYQLYLQNLLIIGLVWLRVKDAFFPVRFEQLLAKVGVEQVNLIEIRNIQVKCHIFEVN